MKRPHVYATMTIVILVPLEPIMNTIRILICHIFLLFNEQPETFVIFRLHDLVYQLQQGAQWQTDNIVVCAFDFFYEN
jgi:hypothetical protein